MLLELDLNDHLKVELVKIADDVKNQKQSELQIQLVDKKSANSTMILAKKSLRWPIGQTLPTKLTYTEGEEQLLVQGPSSEALISFPKAKLEALTEISIAKSKSATKTKTFEAFAVNPVETFDLKSMQKAIQNVIEQPEKEKKWKSLTKALRKCENGEAIGALSAVEQQLFLEAVQQYSRDPDSEKEHVEAALSSIITAKLLSFRAEDQFLKFCVELGKQNIVEEVMKDEERIVSEKMLAELLKLAVGKAEEEKKRALVFAVLFRNFSKAAMLEACSEVLTTTEAIDLMTVLAEIYKEPTKKSIGVSGKALSMITVLMDAHGSRIVYEDKLHQKFAAISNFIIEMQSLVGTFSRLEAAIEENGDNPPVNNVVYRIQPTVTPLSWQ